MLRYGAVGQHHLWKIFLAVFFYAGLMFDNMSKLYVLQNEGFLPAKAFLFLMTCQAAGHLVLM